MLIQISRGRIDVPQSRYPRSLLTSDTLIGIARTPWVVELALLSRKNGPPGSRARLRVFHVANTVRNEKFFPQDASRPRHGNASERTFHAAPPCARACVKYAARKPIIAAANNLARGIVSDAIIAPCKRVRPTSFTFHRHTRWRTEAADEIKFYLIQRNGIDWLRRIIFSLRETKRGAPASIYSRYKAG